MHLTKRSHLKFVGGCRSRGSHDTYPLGNTAIEGGKTDKIQNFVAKHLAK